MIIDLNHCETGREITCDVCIVGTGACGTTLGLEFLNGPHKVLMVESGGASPEPATTDLYRSQITGHSHPGTHTGRARIHGGTTTLWGGQALPLFPIDFEQRPWVPHSGWPISPRDIQDYYPRAAAVMHIEGAPYDEERTIRLGAPPLEPTSGDFERLYSQWSPKPNFARAYRAAFTRSSNVDVLLHANVVNIAANVAVDAVTRLEIKSLSGMTGWVKARYFILCVGGIETARLLLASSNAQTDGLGNRHDLVGRYFQDHIAVKCGWIYPVSRRTVQDVFEQFHRRGVKFLPKLRATDRLQREQRILNVIANVCFAWPEKSGVQATRQFLGALLRGQKPHAGANTGPVPS